MNDILLTCLALAIACVLIAPALDIAPSIHYNTTLYFVMDCDYVEFGRGDGVLLRCWQGDDYIEVTAQHVEREG